MLVRPGLPDLATLRSLGVARLSLGPGLFRLAMTRLRCALGRLRDGDVSELLGASRSDGEPAVEGTTGGRVGLRSRRTGSSARRSEARGS